MLTCVLFSHLSTAANFFEEPFHISNAETPWYINIFPRAQTYAGKTYVVFQDELQDPFIKVYDHINGQWSAAVKLGVNPLPNDDTHGNPVIWIEDNGYIHVYFGSHNQSTGLKHVKSNNPEDIANWTLQPNAAGAHTYAQLSEFTNGNVMHFYRSGGHSIGSATHAPWRFQISTDDGNTFGSATQVTNGSDADVYAMAKVAPNDFIHVFLVVESYKGIPSQIGREDIYHLYRNTSNQWFDSSGSSVSLPVKISDLTKIYDTGGDQTIHVPTVTFNSVGDVFIAFPDGASGDFKSGYKPLTGSWSFSTIGGVSNHWADIALIDSKNSDLFAYITTNGNSSEGFIDRYKSTNNGTTWNKVDSLTTGNRYATPQTIFNGNADAQVTFYSKVDGSLYLWGDSGFLNDPSVSGGNGPTNLALGKVISWSGQSTENPASGATDGSKATDDRWSVNGTYPQWIELDLGENKTINKSVLTPYGSRAYQYKIEAKPDGGSYTTVANKTSNTLGLTEHLDTFTPTNARFVKLTITGASGYTGSWVSIQEFELFNEVINLALGKVSNWSNQQGINPAANLTDGSTDDSDRWSTDAGYPQWVEIDLGSNKTVNRTKLYPYGSRAYNYKIEGKSDGGSYTLLVDKTNNTTNAPVFDDTFSGQNLRYLKLTVTGASGYAGGWISINELEVFSD